MTDKPNHPDAELCSDFAAGFKAVTGHPILLTPNQHKYFEDAGVDMKNLQIYPNMEQER